MIAPPLFLAKQPRELDMVWEVSANGKLSFGPIVSGRVGGRSNTSDGVESRRILERSRARRPPGLDPTNSSVGCAIFVSSPEASARSHVGSIDAKPSLVHSHMR